MQSGLIRAAKYHTELFIYETFVKQLEITKEKKEIELPVYMHMKRLARICGLRMLHDSYKELFFCKYFTGSEGELIKKALKTEINKTRKIVLALIQAIGYRDEFLFSTIGSQFEDPYESLIKQAKEHNPLNKHHVMSGFKKYIQPLSKL